MIIWKRSKEIFQKLVFSFYIKDSEEEKELGDVVVLGPKITNQKPRPKRGQNSDKKKGK